MISNTRRHFIKTSALAMGLAFTPRAFGAPGANDRIRVAVIGLNGRGASHISEYLKLPNVEVATLCDVDRLVLEKHVAAVEKKTGKKPKAETDIRKVLEDKNIDAISIATPNHWHALMTIWGAQAGKHVYVEKPMSHDIGEGRIAVAAQKKYGIVVQHGTQRRSSAQEAGLAAAIKSGKFGRLKISYGYCCKPRKSIGNTPITAPPAHLDWDLWRGPAVIDGYHENLVHYDWHWFWETGNGDLNNQGTHELDGALWAIDDDQIHPTSAIALGGRFQWNDQGVTPNTMFAMASYPNGQQVFFNVRNVDYPNYLKQVQNEYYFEDGGKIIDGKYFAKGSNNGEPLEIEPGKVTPGGSFGAFINAVRANDPSMANGNVMDAHRGCVLGHLMNNSYRLGEKVPFNKKAGSFGDNKEAAEHFGRLHDIMANGVGVPEDGNHYTAGPLLTFDPATERFTGEHAEAANRLVKDKNREGFAIPEINAV